MGPLGDQYRERLIRRGRQAASIRNFERAWTALLVFAASYDKLPKELGPECLSMFFASLNLAPSTKRLYLAQIRAGYRYGIARGTITSDPTIDIELPQEPDRMVRVLSNQKLREIKANCHGQREWLMFHLFAYTGCRKNEIRELYWDGVSLENETLFVVGKRGKGRLVPIHPALGEILAQMKHRPGQSVIANTYGRPYHYTYYDDILKSFAPDVTFHDFRRTVASSLDKNGVEEGVIMKIMGWAPKTVFDRHYRHVASDRLQQAILRLYADDPI